MKRSPRPLARHARSRKPLGEYIVSQRDDVVPDRVDIPVHVADQMPDACRLGQVARMNDQHVLVCRADDIGGLGVVVQELTGMKNRPGRELQREDGAVWSLDQPPNTATIDGAHRQFDDGNAARWFGVRMNRSDRNRS